jgi:hypothetical protein
MLRGDCGFGNEDIMAWPEANGLHLFKQRMTVKTKDLVHSLDLGQGWTDAGQGWFGIESQLRFWAWTRTRRVVILRRKAKQRSAIHEGRIFERTATGPGYRRAIDHRWERVNIRFW